MIPFNNSIKYTVNTVPLSCHLFHKKKQFLYRLFRDRNQAIFDFQKLIVLLVMKRTLEFN